jgi:uncharacterized membrane protein
LSAQQLQASNSGNMKVLNLFFKRETAAPMLALGFASVACVVLVLARIVWTGQLRYGFLIANLFLAWMPLVFALLACDKYQTETGRRWKFLGLAGAWLLFFPNSPYIFTDIIHLTNRYYFHFWIDLVLILVCALTGLVVGFVSLYLMQSIAARMFGRLASWLFVAVVTGLSSFGVYLGRFLRLNSWDVVVRPGKIYHGLGVWAGSVSVNRTSVGFLLMFAAFLFLAYVMLYALTHLSPARLTAESPPLKPA